MNQVTTFYVVELQNGVYGAEVPAPPGYSEEEAYELALERYPGWEIVGHHIEWFVPKNKLH